MAGPEVRPGVRSLAEYLAALDPEGARALMDALDPKRWGKGPTTVMLKPVAAQAVKRFVRTRGVCVRRPGLRLPIAVRRERREHRPRRRTAARRAAGCRSGQDPGEPPREPKSECWAPLCGRAAR
jgi:hypothetical protein